MKLNQWMNILLGIFVLIGLYLTTLYSYLLFHTLIEIFFVIIAFSIFLIVWNSRPLVGNNYFLLMAIAFLCVGAINLIHTLACQGLGVFYGYDANLPTQLWIAERYIQSLSLLIAPLFISRRVNLPFIWISYTGAIGLLLLSIFHFNIFPVCFVEGIGWAPFKKISNYVIYLILIFSLASLNQKRWAFDTKVLPWLVLSIVLNIASELALILSLNVYDLSNLIGHFFKIISIYLFYRGLIETGVTKPDYLLFKKLKQSEEVLRHAHDELEKRVRERTAEVLAANEQLLQEIKERERTEEALRESETKYRFLVENANEAIFVVQDGTLQFFNPNTTELLGYSKEELASKPFVNFIHPEDRERVLEPPLKRTEGKMLSGIYPFRIVDQEGKIKWVEINAVFISWKGRPATLNFLIDITDRKKSEERLSKLKECFLNFGTDSNKNINQLVALCGEELGATYALYHHLEGRMLYPLGQWNTPSDYHPGDPPEGHICYDVIRSNQEEVCVIPHLAQTPYAQADSNITRYDLKTAIGKMVSSGGVSVGSLCVFYQEDRIPSEDDKKFLEIISSAIGVEEERKRAEEALRKSEEEERRLVRENEIMAEIGQIISSTLNIEEVYDRFAEEVLKLISFDRISINIVNPEEENATVAYATGVDVIDSRPGDVFPLIDSTTEAVMRARSGLLLQTEDINDLKSRFPSLLTTFQAGLRSMISVPLFSKDQVIGSLHIRSLKPNAYTESDLRLVERVGDQIAGAIANAQLFAEHERSEIEKAALQEELRQSQKIEAIGRLAGGIAHDFNNLLTVISGNCQLSLIDLKEGDPLKGNIEEISIAADRATILTRQLLAFSRRQPMKMKVVNLNTLLRDLDKMLRRVIGEDIELVALMAENLGRIRTDPGQIEQVILNLAVNARDAMPNGGKLIIETTNVELDEEYTYTHIGMKPGRYVRLSVSDTGIGMNEEVKERIFEPFFTTKEKEKGTGLGLSTVYGIVKQSGGNIWVYSEVGHGTTFKIYLSQVDEPVELTEEKMEGKEAPRGRETILLVEDEGAVRKLAVQFLKRQGYRVLEAPQGGDAILICKKHQGPIHLMVTDVIMPGMSGRELAENLLVLRPEMKVLYMSGYTDEAIVHHGVLEKEMNYIQKPFPMEGLAIKVREVLDQGLKDVI